MDHAARRLTGPRPDKDPPVTEIAHYIDNARVAGTSGRNQPVYNPATGEAEKTAALCRAAAARRARWRSSGLPTTAWSRAFCC